MKISRTLLTKFSRNECTSEEIQAIREWLDDGSWPLFEHEEIPDEIRQKVWNRLHAKMNTSSPGERRIRKWNGNLGRVAAILLVAIGAATFYYYSRSDESRQMVYATNANEHRKVLLSDSSVVFMSPNSSLEVRQPFAKDKREIILHGQAVFEVAKDASRPFSVITGNVSTTALGTSFKVTSFPDRNEINVVLSYGKVVVKDQSEHAVVPSLFLEPGEEIIYDKTSRAMRKEKAPVQQFDYKNNILYFKAAGLKEVVEKLERYYHVKVNYSSLDSVQWCLSGEFDYQPLETVMKTIAYSCNINYAIKKDKDMVVLTPILPAKGK